MQGCVQQRGESVRPFNTPNEIFAPAVAAAKGKLSGSVTPAIRSNFGETGLCASKLASSSRVSRVGAAAGLLRGLRGGARGGAEVPATRGPIWRSLEVR
jgi:hypothetical protein